MGHRVIRGALIPSGYLIGSLKIDVKDSIAPQNLTDHVVFGLGKFITEDLVNNLTESIVITNV
jgi:hypothetical protein